MEAKKLTRKELYDLLWSTPMITILEQYNLSYARLRKICNEMDIPTPGLGHWEKIKAGKDVLILELPEYDGPGHIDLNIREKGEIGFPGTLNPEKKIILELESDPSIMYPCRKTGLFQS